MPPLTLEGDALGEKRRHFNKLVADAVASKHYELTPTSDTDSDIDNLLKIEIACKARNVDYVIEVMKSKDMLYAATAIKKSTWLITDPQYANIINPEYLHTQLKPYMTNKAFNKLMLHIRLNLKDESRVQIFYEYCKDTDSAYHWLQNCSMPYIENVIKNERLVPKWLFKRLCKRSSHFFAYNTRVELYPHERGQLVLFMLKSHTDDVLNILEDKTVTYVPELGKKRTEFLLKTCPHRIFDNIKKYNTSLDTSVLIKHINKDEIGTFLHKHANELGYYWETEKLNEFIRKMDEEERVEFIRKSFIDRTDMIFKKDEMKWFDDLRTHSYEWYEFFPFDMAFTKIKNVIQKQTSPSERCAMLSVLVKSAKHNSDHIKTLVTYVFEKHINVPFKFKIKFINNLLSNVSTHEFDEATWNILNQIFHSMDVYSETENDVQLCLESIIMRKVLNDEPVPEVIEQKCTFKSFKNVVKTLNEEQKRKLFTYVFDSLLEKVKHKTYEKESDFEKTVNTLQNMFILLKDWDKTLTDFPIVIEKIKELIKAKEENNWTTDMSCLYNVNKSWRKYMFEESLSLSLCEETCLNALKHKPQLLTRHDKQIHTLRTNDTVSLRRVLAKLRVYWPDSLARHWKEAYLQSLNEPTGQKSVIKGLFVLLTANQVVELSKKYVPIDYSITGDNSDKSNYRPISLATTTAKVLDGLLERQLKKHLTLNDAQFGFRPGLSTECAVMSLKQTVRYYTDRSTPVYAAFLDLSRAFDLVRYDILWHKLKYSGVPGEIINMFKYWYDHQTNQVKWLDELSDEYRLECGVRQGGLTSPTLFNLYVNGLIDELSNIGVGCSIDGCCINSISYADDMVLLSPSVAALRKLIGVCEKYARVHGLLYNEQKSELMVFQARGRKLGDVAPVLLNAVTLQRVKEFKYLGHMVTEDLKDDRDIERERRAMAVRCNMLARRFAGCSLGVKITLFKAFCQTLYTCNLWVRYTQRAINALRVQYNNAFRVLVGLPRCCSASAMFAHARTDAFHAVLRRRIASLMFRTRGSANTILSVLSQKLDSPLMRHWIQTQVCVAGASKGGKYLS